MATRIIIVGGGISGLATAWYLRKYAAEASVDLEIEVRERASRCGGKVVTDRRDGFVLEGGPDSCITTVPAGYELFEELGLKDDIITTKPESRKVYIAHKGRLEEMPAGMRLTVPTQARAMLKSRLMSPLGKLRMMAEIFIPARKETTDESMADFVRRRFGQQTLDRIAQPLMAGIYVADPEYMSLHSTFKQFAIMEREKGSLILAMRAAAKKMKQAPPRPMFVSLRNGMGQVVERLHEELADIIRTDAPVSSIEELDADVIVLATLANTSATLVESANSALAEQLRQIRFVSTATVSLAFEKSALTHCRPIDGYGFVVPRAEKREILACTWTSMKFENRASEDHVLMRAFVGGDAHEELLKKGDDVVIAAVRRELKELMGLQAEPCLTHITHWPEGNPQYDVGHADRIAAIRDAASATPGLFLTSCCYDGIGIPNCIAAARRTAKAVLESVAAVSSDQ
ncbi:MAG: oxygen-dependent protoporphyrinogen oxidase [Rhodothermales bacterium]|jgi:oxygen-dependent protoporphyrinogen oxidase